MVIHQCTLSHAMLLRGAFHIRNLMSSAAYRHSATGLTPTIPSSTTSGRTLCRCTGRITKNTAFCIPIKRVSLIRLRRRVLSEMVSVSIRSPGLALSSPQLLVVGETLNDPHWHPFSLPFFPFTLFSHQSAYILSRHSVRDSIFRGYLQEASLV